MPTGSWFHLFKLDELHFWYLKYQFLSQSIYPLVHELNIVQDAGSQNSLPLPQRSA